jgi:hypothetical protein
MTMGALLLLPLSWAYCGLVFFLLYPKYAFFHSYDMLLNVLSFRVNRGLLEIWLGKGLLTGIPALEPASARNMAGDDPWDSIAICVGNNARSAGLMPSECVCMTPKSVYSTNAHTVNLGP